MTRRTSLLLMCSAVASAFVTDGCSSHDDDHHDRSRDRIETRRPDYPPQAAGPVYTNPGVREIPRDAIRLEKDEGPEMRVRPEREGRIFVYDERDGRIAYEGQLHPNEEFVAIPQRNEVMIDGRRVEGVRLDPHARYQLYYLRD